MQRLSGWILVSFVPDQESREIAALLKSGSADVNSYDQIVIGGWADKLSQTRLAVCLLDTPQSALVHGKPMHNQQQQVL